MLDKFCNKCKEIKIVAEFYKESAKKDGLRTICISCTKNTKQKYYSANKEKIAEKDKKYYKKNKDRILKRTREFNKKYYQINKEKILQKTNLYKKENREKININVKKRKKIDLNYKLKILLRDRLNKALKHNYKAGSAVKDLGCSIEDLKIYLEVKFQEGMTWDNHGQWHIDHIRPLSRFNITIREELLKACHYTNLQPLWAEDNLIKGSKYIGVSYGNNY